jgi:hypothetical protein
MQAMLVPQTRISRRPDIFLPPETLPPQTIEQLWFLDAKTGNDKYSPRLGVDGVTTRFDSVKMLPEEALQQLFDLYPQGQGRTLALVQGVDHPEYCQDILQLAQEQLTPKGWQVVLLATDPQLPRQEQLKEITSWIMQSRHIIGMDTGTMHLANVVARSLAYRTDRRINLYQIFNGHVLTPQTFGLWGLPAEQAQLLVVQTTFDQRYDNAKSCLQYLTGQDLLCFLADCNLFDF